MAKKIKVGVIGVGYLGQHHARLYKTIKGVELVGVVDTDIKRAKEIAEKNQTVYFSDYKDLKDVDAVSIVVPTNLHFKTAEYFLKQGIDVLVEKPFTNTLKQAERLLKLSIKNNVVLQVGHVERFNGAVLNLKKYIKNPMFIEVHRLSSFPKRSTDVGAVLDIMIHDLDIVLYLVKSKPVKIDSFGAKVLTDKEDIANARIIFENGCVANLTASRMSWEGQRKLRVFQKNSYVSLDYQNQTLYMFRYPKNIKKKSVPTQQDIEVIPVPVQKTEPLKLELEYFIKSVKNRKKPVVTGEDGRDVLLLAMKILSKMKTNR